MDLPAFLKLFVLGGIPVIGLVALLIYDRLKRRGSTGPAADATGPAAKAKRNPWPVWVWIVLVVGLFLAFQEMQQAARRRAPAREISWMAVSFLVAPPAFLLGLIGLVYFIQSRRFSDPVCKRALDRGNAGDIDGAIAELTAELENAKPTAQRLITLGLLRLNHAEPAEAYKCFLAAEELGGDMKANAVANQGLALTKLGRHEEALAAFDRAGEAPPLNAIVPCYRSQALAGLGRFDEARQQLDRAEAALQRLAYLSRGGRAQSEQFVAQYRQDLAKAEGAKGADLAEL